MTALLLDLTFLVDTERDGIDLDTFIGDDDDVAVAAITIAELLAGVILATGKRRVARQAFVEEAISSIPILAYDHAVAIEHAELLMAVRIAGRPRAAHDLIIAATARAAHRTVVTIDAAPFSDLPGVGVRSHR